MYLLLNNLPLNIYDVTIFIINKKKEKKRIMNLIKPKKLKAGDTIGLISLSGNREQPEKTERAKNYFRNKGFNVVVSDNSDKSFRYHAGTDEERAKAFNDFIKDDNIDAVVCTRGGYGVLRIISRIDYKSAAKNPKIICGYSDITILLLMLLKKSNLVTFHGPMTDGDFSIDNISPITENSFFETLTGTAPLTFKTENEALVKGEAKGILWGGNLVTVASMAGIDFIPNRKFIFFTEDVCEPDYKIDRALTQLFNLTKFRNNICGMVIGEFTDSDRQMFTRDVIKEYAQKYNIPCSDGFCISHGYNKFTLPVGVKCSFNSEEKTLKISETPFCD